MKLSRFFMPRTIESPVGKHWDDCSGLPARAIPGHGCKPTVWGALCLAVFLCLSNAAPAQDFQAVLDDPIRPASDRARDTSRRPDLVLKFYGVKPGDRVADLMAGGGYYTAVLSLVVGDRGLVYSANSRARKQWVNMLKQAVFANVKSLVGPMDKVALPEDSSLDFVLIHLNYHDLPKPVRMGMNKRVLAALKPGGGYGIVDHAANEGAGEVGRTLHRIEKNAVIQEAQAAGFVLAREGEMLRNPKDDRAQRMSKNRGKTDRFVLRFERPK